MFPKRYYKILVVDIMFKISAIVSLIFLAHKRVYNLHMISLYVH